MCEENYKKELNDYKKLRRNWDSYGAYPPSKSAIKRAEEICAILTKEKIPFILFPIHKGVSIQIYNKDETRFCDIDIQKHYSKIYEHSNFYSTLRKITYKEDYIAIITTAAFQATLWGE